jgi:hypothetical protein
VVAFLLGKWMFLFSKQAGVGANFLAITIVPFLHQKGELLFLYF